MRADSAPDRGDVVWIDMSPTSGHEQSGRRPALVLSPLAYNMKSGIALMCPVTSRVKGYPFEVALPETAPVSGVVLSDQVKSLDWRERRAEIAGRVTEDVSETVLQRVGRLLAP